MKLNEMNLFEYLKYADLTEFQQELINNIGIEAFLTLCSLCGGTTIYVPKLNNILRKARNRKIMYEFKGRSKKELATKYEITVRQIETILKDLSHSNEEV